MSETVLKNRSILVVPAHWPMQKLHKAREYGADAILWDLEDGVPEDAKETARQNLREISKFGTCGQEMVRINRLSTEAGQRELLDFGWRFPVVVPKWTGGQLTAGAALGFYALVETAEGVRDVEFLTLESGLLGVLFGDHDLAHELGVTSVYTAAVEQSACRVAMLARAEGLPCWGAPTMGLEAADVRAYAYANRSQGFTGMGAIHPAQVPVINEVYSQAGAPSPMVALRLLAKEPR